MIHKMVQLHILGEGEKWRWEVRKPDGSRWHETSLVFRNEQGATLAGSIAARLLMIRDGGPCMITTPRPWRLGDGWGC